jgi:GNAT superfamily N-acetyltransferase
VIDIVSPVYDTEMDQPLLEEVRQFLARHEAINSIQLASLFGRDTFDPATAVLVARDESGIAGVATLPGTFNMVVSRMDDERPAEALAHAVIERNIAIPGVMGPVSESTAFADAWVSRTGGTKSPGMAQRLLATSKVHPPANVAGNWRPAVPADQALLIEWFVAFMVEAVGMAPEAARQDIGTRFPRSDDYNGELVWVDDVGTPVSLARYKSPTLSGIRIGPVYTPPEHRRHGYAAAVTAAAAQLMLERGRAFVCLYTDAANATANHVYESIGFRFVTDSAIFRLQAGEAS